MSMEQKIALTKRFAVFQFELSGLEKQDSAFKSIGTLDSPEFDLQADFKVPQAAVTPERTVSHEFFMGDHLEYDIPRGPFRSTHDWLSAILAIIIRHQTLVLENSEDEDDIEDAGDILPVAQSLLALLPKDLNLNNILVNEKGQITAVIDWEFDDQPREDEPQRDSYANDTPGQAIEEEDECNDPDYLNNEGKNGLYWIHQMEYETTQLRKVYKANLEELCPGSVKESPLKDDFYEAVLQCDGIWKKKVRRWAECIEKGDFVRFEDV
ncbi:kinase [Fusarium beomiforme]|uniref:Kinase n=1 Tax=Fusarium beomiforme TaxID=44412 RepID=A0A9P5DT49_9HYPO|nr:kinase [Fusarium beomiforme]